jgi:hypothetical protein
MNRYLIRFHHAKPTKPKGTHFIRPKGCCFLRQANRSLGIGARRFVKNSAISHESLVPSGFPAKLADFTPNSLKLIKSAKSFFEKAACAIDWTNTRLAAAP